ncbi:glycosyltransferase family 32 protein [Jeongeupia sp. USM3]|uniref:glycosyltransferase family 32 protein n=1 Tax=Jeongeupia sp. USM3 TaxID=1906741 RepID=UPI00196A4F42|nr:glycosyltransferase [Jeongeupia sp. USM3]
MLFKLSGLRMIPKIIHFCWFGRGKKSELIERCMRSWKRYLPDYEFMEWNEDSFDISQNRYVAQAYEQKKWAFVTDYVRLWAIEKFGGIYLDTDVEVFQSLDEFLVHSGFTGFELYNGKLAPITAVIAAENGHPIILDLLSDYESKLFIGDDGELDLATNVELIKKKFFHDYGVINNNKHQVIDGGFHIYPDFYFCNKSNKRSYTMHHFGGSWLSPRKRLKTKLARALFKLIGG